MKRSFAFIAHRIGNSCTLNYLKCPNTTELVIKLFYNMSAAMELEQELGLAHELSSESELEHEQEAEHENEDGGKA
jgi:hypothetical protein